MNYNLCGSPSQLRFGPASELADRRQRGQVEGDDTADGVSGETEHEQLISGTFLRPSDGRKRQRLAGLHQDLKTRDVQVSQKSSSLLLKPEGRYVGWNRTISL